MLHIVVTHLTKQPSPWEWVYIFSDLFPLNLGTLQFAPWGQDLSGIYVLVCLFVSAWTSSESVSTWNFCAHNRIFYGRCFHIFSLFMVISMKQETLSLVPKPLPGFSPRLRDKIWKWPEDEARKHSNLAELIYPPYNFFFADFMSEYHWWAVWSVNLSTAGIYISKLRLHTCIVVHFVSACNYKSESIWYYNYILPLAAIDWVQLFYKTQFCIFNNQFSWEHPYRLKTTVLLWEVPSVQIRYKHSTAQLIW